MLDINVTLGETAAASDRALANNGASELNGCLETRYLNLRKEIEPVPSLAIVPDSYSSGVLFSQLPSHRTNFITNNTMQGAAPNVFPTGWSTSTGTLTATCIASGVENDIEYIDIQVSGTATSGFLNIRPNLTPSGIPAAVNDNFCGSIYYKLVSGSFPNPPNLQIQELNNSSFLSGSTVNTPATSTLTRVEVNRTMNQPTVNNVGIRWGHDANGTFNYVVRLGLPQLERGLKAGNIIRTKGTLVSVYQSPTNIITQGGDFIVSRNTGATRVGPNGLIEAGNTNLALHSQAFDVSGTWALVSGGTGSLPVVSANAVIFPDGTQNAETVVFNRGAGNAAADQSFLQQNITIPTSGTYTFSVYAKASVAGDVGKQIFIRLGGAGGLITITLTANWVRYSRTETSVASGSQIVQIGNRGTFTADNSVSVDLWGAQVEVGSSASEYIPTTTVARTRFAGVTVDGTIAANIPRIDWFGQSCPGLLVEASGQNLALQSEAFNVNWSRSRASAFGSGSVANAVTAPDGTMTADYIQQETGQTDRGGVFTPFTIVSGTIYTFSVFAKKSDSNFLQLGAAWISPGNFAEFNLDTGTIGTVASGITARIVDFGSGWYRCSITGTSQFSGARNHFIYQNEVPTAVPGTGIYIWGAQLETGSIATTYIPTTTAAVSRAADVISASGALVSGLIGQTEGTIYAEVDIRLFGNLGVIAAISDGTSSNRLVIYKFTDSKIYFDRISATQSALTSAGSSAYTASTILKIAVGYKSGDSQMYINGVAVTTQQTQTFTFGTLTKVNIGSNWSDGQLFNDRIRAAALYTTRLSNDQLQRLTSFYEPEYDNINLWNAFTQRYSNPDPCLYNRLCALLY